MKNILISNIFMIIIIAGYTAFVLGHYIRFKKFAGLKLKEYKHKSTVRLMGFIMLAIGIFYVILFIIEKTKTPTMIFTFCLFLYFIILVAFISIRNILMYQNGLVYAGKFVLYKDIVSVDKLNKQGIEIKMNKKGFSGNVYINKIQDEKTFINDLKKHIKLAKKNAKKKDKE